MKQVAQLALAVQLPDDENFDSFQSEANQAVVKQLQDFIDGKSALKSQPHGFYLFGLGGVGKSHLLHASSAYAALLGKSSLCLSFSELKLLSVEMLDGLEQIDLICLDDLHLIAGDDIWQQAVFDLYNRVVEQNKRLLITGNQSAQQLGITLPDLVSRIGWGYTEQVKVISDAEKIKALQYRALQRGLILHDDVVKFLLNRLSRDMRSLIKTLDILDKASIREQRKITIPFIKETLL
ncbi:DnaA regulatory inactivator Hda [Thalassomonas haliotis]|uniref:DnaA regulatory inactivator Hda n=1 Tax=Thalassomonas haliotis TaxID=485448 RepID=A0ABY7V8Y3_9GAMM|nr:DnaA regulatory inactivator Hda [Thalassomonas haliotis]WDE10052.1 DnaA regulatory inactivator Hda [Thalassomonas haliotis]